MRCSKGDEPGFKSDQPGCKNPPASWWIFGGHGRNRTGASRFCRPQRFHFATWPREAERSKDELKGEVVVHFPYMKPSVVQRYLQEIIFGFEDSFVSTVGAVTGMAVGSGSREIVILAGLVIIFVEATSMAGGSYLSDRAGHDVDRAHGGDKNDGHRPVMAGIVMGSSYLIAGVVPLAPYLFLPVAPSIVISILFTLLMLFFIGAWQTVFTKRTWYKSGGEMLAVGGAAIVLGFIIGRVASALLGINLYGV